MDEEGKEKPEAGGGTDKASIVQAVREALGGLLGSGEVEVIDKTEKKDPAKPATRRDVESDAHEQAKRAVREVMDAEELEALRKEKQEREKAPPPPGRHRPITRWLWGEGDR